MIHVMLVKLIISSHIFVRPLVVINIVVLIAVFFPPLLNRKDLTLTLHYMPTRSLA